ncbi:hypothetical protein CDAR_482181 [Caerostris darwini]|uniref:Uncharacterized protein n=1 Tax=Caerostris darwini TaxID=1538125 RepID=A0AAV4TIR6_9ARAC|nr:hypothetical protein CDAR_482181 [Caerostris darwini]
MHVPGVYYMPENSFRAITREDELICWIRTARTWFQLESMVFQTHHSRPFYVVTSATSRAKSIPPACPSQREGGKYRRESEGPPPFTPEVRLQTCKSDGGHFSGNKCPFGTYTSSLTVRF